MSVETSEPPSSSSSSFFPDNLTPSSQCTTPYTPSIHDSERASLVEQIKTGFTRGAPFRVPLREHRCTAKDYQTHVLNPICRELITLGWFPRVVRVETVLRDVYTDYEYHFHVNAVPLHHA